FYGAARNVQYFSCLLTRKSSEKTKTLLFKSLTGKLKLLLTALLMSFARAKGLSYLHIGRTP
ncbi:MAG TPA: hypothetical protein VEZ55_17555, partial [Chitinophagaceae bacterium]|nr:hypothetical protein [Chitinophagaceae bacterium]